MSQLDKIFAPLELCITREQIDAELYKMKSAHLKTILAACRLLPLCSDHRDKQKGKPCLACKIEELEAVLQRANKILLKIVYAGDVLSQPEFDETVSIIDKINELKESAENTPEDGN